MLKFSFSEVYMNKSINQSTAKLTTSCSVHITLFSSESDVKKSNNMKSSL